MLQMHERLGIYAALAMTAVIMLLTGGSVAGSWVAVLILVGLGFWVELDDYHEEEEEDE